MNDLTPKQRRKAMSQFISLEARLDTVLFRRNDDDEDYRHPYLAGAAGVGAGVGGTVGVGALVSRGKSINTMPEAQPSLPGFEPPKPKTGYFSNLATGTRATATQAEGGIRNIFNTLFRRGVKTVK